MRFREQWHSARAFLSAAVERLAQIPRDQIARWPEYPGVPEVNLEVPTDYAGFQFTPMKDTLSDGTIRVAVQMYRHRFMGIGAMTADGFFIEPSGSIRRFTEEDTWEVT
jgi:hypothetical protein